MAFNGSGSYSPPGASFPAVSGALIESAKFNNIINDAASALSTTICKDGQTTITANLPMAGFRHTGVGNAVSTDDYAAYGQVQNSSSQWAGTATGTANAMTLTLTPAITAYAAGQSFTYKSSASANTGAMTVAINGLTTKAIQKDGAALASGDHPASKWFRITYDGTAFQLEQIAPMALKANLASPTFTGVPAAPTAAVSTNTTQLATTAFVMAQTATTTRSGHLETATDAEAQAGTDAAKIVTPDNLGAVVPGVGQMWQNMTASRTYNTPFTNSTGRPMAVNISVTSTSTTHVVLTVGGSALIGSAGGSGFPLTVSAIIPAGDDYSVAVAAGTGSLVANGWHELR